MFRGWGHYTKWLNLLSFFTLFVSRQCSKLTFCAEKRSSFAKKRYLCANRRLFDSAVWEWYPLNTKHLYNIYNHVTFIYQADLSNDTAANTIAIIEIYLHKSKLVVATTLQNWTGIGWIPRKIRTEIIEYCATIIKKLFWQSMLDQVQRSTPNQRESASACPSRPVSSCYLKLGGRIPYLSQSPRALTFQYITSGHWTLTGCLFISWVRFLTHNSRRQRPPTTFLSFIMKGNWCREQNDL